MPIFNDPGVYVIQEIMSRPADATAPELPAAIIGPLFQVVDTDDETETDGELDEEALDNLDDITVTYPELKDADNPVDEETVEVYLHRDDGRSAEIPENYIEITPEEVTVSLKEEGTDTELGDFYKDLNDEWLGQEVDYEEEDPNYDGIEGATIHVSYRSVREDLVGRVIIAEGTEDTQVQLGKFSPENPLGMAGGIASDIAPNDGVYYVPTKDYMDGVSEDASEDDEISAALGRLEPKKVYNVAALTDDLAVGQSVLNHVNEMSEPEEGMYRYAWLSTEMPDEDAVRDHLDLEEGDELTEVSKKEAQKDILVQEATSIYDKRATLLFQPFTMTVDGEEVELESFYHSVIYAVMNSRLEPQQGLTNYPVPAGIEELKYGDDYFKPSQLTELSNNGVWVSIQDTPGAPIRCRAQWATNTLNNAKKQVSITNSADSFSYTVIDALDNIIGIRNINPDVLEEIEETLQAIISSFRNSGRLIDAQIQKLRQDPDRQYRVEVEIEATFPSPLDQIIITLRY